MAVWPYAWVMLTATAEPDRRPADVENSILAIKRHSHSAPKGGIVLVRSAVKA